MARTHFSGPVASAAGFEGELIQTSITDYSADGAISPAAGIATISKGTAAAMTLAAPGASNVGKFLTVISKSAAAHVVTITGLDTTNNTMTFGAAIGNSFKLYAQSATVWSVISLNGVTLSTI